MITEIQRMSLSSLSRVGRLSGPTVAGVVFGGKTCFDQNASKKLCDKIKEIFAAFRFVVPFRCVIFSTPSSSPLSLSLVCCFCCFALPLVYIERREKINTKGRGEKKHLKVFSQTWQEIVVNHTPRGPVPVPVKQISISHCHGR